MDCFDFLERVEGALLWHEYESDVNLNNFAWYTANLMLSSGNMKKGTNALELKKSLYMSLEDVVENAQDTQEKKKQDAQEEREKLKARFNL